MSNFTESYRIFKRLRFLNKSSGISSRSLKLRNLKPNRSYVEKQLIKATYIAKIIVKPVSLKY